MYREGIFRDPLLAKDMFGRFAGATFKLLNLRSRAIYNNRVYNVLLLPIELYSYGLGTLAELNIPSFIYLLILPENL